MLNVQVMKSDRYQSHRRKPNVVCRCLILRLFLRTGEAVVGFPCIPCRDAAAILRSVTLIPRVAGEGYLSFRACDIGTTTEILPPRLRGQNDKELNCGGSTQMHL
jgi:hypothetical protein